MPYKICPGRPMPAKPPVLRSRPGNPVMELLDRPIAITFYIAVSPLSINVTFTTYMFYSADSSYILKYISFLEFCVWTNPLIMLKIHLVTTQKRYPILRIKVW